MDIKLRNSEIQVYWAMKVYSGMFGARHLENKLSDCGFSECEIGIILMKLNLLARHEIKKNCPHYTKGGTMLCKDCITLPECWE